MTEKMSKEGGKYVGAQGKSQFTFIQCTVAYFLLIAVRVAYQVETFV